MADQQNRIFQFPTKKKFIGYVHDHILTKGNARWVIITALLLLFGGRLGVLLPSQLLLPDNPFTHRILDVFLVSLVLTLFFFLWAFGYKVSSNQTKAIITADLLFWIFHLSPRKGLNWQLARLEYCPIFSYVGILLILLSGFVGLSWICFFIRKSNKKKAKKKFEKDRSASIAPKKFERFKSTVDYVKNEITDNHEAGYSIGIIGPWGLGKSSFYTALKKELDNEPSEYLYIEFSPFKNYGENELTHSFFASLGDQLRRYDGKLASNLFKYAKNLVQAYKSSDLSAALDGFKDMQTTNELFDRIDQSIKSIRPKVVVLIDDLDRLEGSEIIQVLKLIRNTACFENLTYLMAFDKAYVKKAIAGEKNYMADKYLEKFINLEIFIPMIGVDTILQDFGENLKQRLNSAKISESTLMILTEKINELIKNKDDGTMLPNVLTDYRISNKIIDQLVFETMQLNKETIEIKFTDHIYLILLKLTFPEVFYLIFNEPISYLEDVNHYYVLKKNEQNIAQAIKQDIYSNGNVNLKELQKLLDVLFDRTEKQASRIAYKNTFNKYKELNVTLKSFTKEDGEAIIKHFSEDKMEGIKNKYQFVELFIFLMKEDPKETESRMNKLKALCYLNDFEAETIFSEEYNRSTEKAIISSIKSWTDVDGELAGKFQHEILSLNEVSAKNTWIYCRKNLRR